LATSERSKKMTEIVNALGDLDRLMDQTMALGQRHVAYGVTPSHYATVRTALLNAFRVLLGDRFDNATREAWILAYNLIEECTLSGATQHRCQLGSATQPASPEQRARGRGVGTIE
jgi:hemoglobin-like flavoprotein